MHPLVAEQQDRIASICRTFGVRRLELFGSAARGKDFNLSTSDVDFLVEFTDDNALPPLERFFGLAERLQDLLGRRVDLVDPKAVRNPYLLAGINASRELIFGG